MKELLVWVLPNNGYETVPTLKEHLQAFRREHPGVGVSVWVRTEGSLWERLLRLLKEPGSRPRPDIVQIPSHWTSSLAHLGVLKDLGEIDPALDLGTWDSSLRDHCRLADSSRVYSLPWWMEVRLLYYRLSAFEKTGIDPGEAFATWDGFRKACRELSKGWRPGRGTFYPVANPNSRESVSMTDLAPCVWTRGGTFFSKDRSRSLFQHQAACRGIEDYFGLLAAGWMPLRGESGLPPRDLFDGGCAVQFSGRLPARAGRSRPPAPEEIRALPFPGRESCTLLAAHNLAIVRDTESPRESYALLKELVGPGGSAAYAERIGAFPAALGGVQKVLAGYPGVREAFETAFARARMLPNLRVAGALEKVFDRSMKTLVQSVVRKNYSSAGMRQELIHAAAEMDYILSLYN